MTAEGGGVKEQAIVSFNIGSSCTGFTNNIAQCGIATGEKKRAGNV
ncbi:hypothetical protein [Planktothrix sp. FACHB-1365]|nr:hypothetical protein [Planktothrix sp. FACHB-1365]